MNDLTNAVLALAVISAFLLVLGGIYLMREKATRTRGILMLVASAVLFMNVMIWTV